MNGSIASRKKQHERFLLERFLENAGLAAKVIEERESPDFIVWFENQPIGIELSQLFVSHDSNQNLLQAQESISAKIVRHAQEIYRASSGQAARISVCFRPGCDLRKLNRDRTATSLASFVTGLSLIEWKRVDWRPEESDAGLPDEISFIHALGVPSFDLAHWSVVRAGWAASLTIDAIQSRVDEKSSHLQSYRKIVTQNWLVVVADATNPSGLFDTSQDTSQQSALRAVSSPFCRTFFYSYPGRALIELGASAGQHN